MQKTSLCCNARMRSEGKNNTQKKNQGRSEGTSSAALEVLIINCKIDFINLFIFNCLTSNINLFIFNCLTSNINLFNFNCLTSNFCFLKYTSLANRRKRLLMDACLYFRILNSYGKMMTCYLRDTHPLSQSNC